MFIVVVVVVDIVVTVVVVVSFLSGNISVQKDAADGVGVINEAEDEEEDDIKDAAKGEAGAA